MSMLGEEVNKLIARVSRVTSDMPMLDRGVKPCLNQSMEIAQNRSQGGMTKTMP